MENKDNKDDYDVLTIFIQLSDLHVKMMENLETRLVLVGGSIEDFSLVDGIVNVKVPAESEDVIAEYVKELIIQYNNERAEILKSDPLIGIKAFLFEEDFN